MSDDSGRYDEQEELNSAWASIYDTLRNGALAFELRNTAKTPQERYAAGKELLERLATKWYYEYPNETLETQAIMAELEVLITLGENDE